MNPIRTTEVDAQVRRQMLDAVLAALLSQSGSYGTHPPLRGEGEAGKVSNDELRPILAGILHVPAERIDQRHVLRLRAKTEQQADEAARLFANYVHDEVQHLLDIGVPLNQVAAYGRRE